MNKLTAASMLTHLQCNIDSYLPLQIDDPAHPEYGAVLNPDEGMTGAWQSEKLIKLIAYQALLSGHIDETLVEKALLAADHLVTAQRPSGLIDLRGVNIDSSPDTGFTVQALCALYDVAKAQNDAHPLWSALLSKLEQFIRTAIPGLKTGGFHTPNHRWVITSAMVYAHHLFPDLNVAEAVESYLAEGFDIDADGTFIERSIGVYDAVNNRALLIIGEFWNRPDAFDAVARNLDFDLHMLHADGTAITNLSRRQDYGTRRVPDRLIYCYMLLNHHRPNPVWESAAAYLFGRMQPTTSHRYWDFGVVDWICYALLKGGDPSDVSTPLPSDFSRYYPVNGIWRVRRDELSASLFRGKTGLLSLVYGSAELSSVKVSFTYFGRECGWFFGDEATVAGSRAVLHSTGMNHPRRPAYELPLGRPVAPEDWHSTMHERELRRLPPFASNLTVTEVDGGFDLHLQTLDGLDNVAAQIAFDFAPGGIWETADTRAKIAAGQSLFLKQGVGTMRYGNDVIQIGPGSAAHGFWQMRAAQPAPDHVRVLVTFFTPIDHHFHIRAYRGWQSEVAV